MKAVWWNQWAPPVKRRKSNFKLEVENGEAHRKPSDRHAQHRVYQLRSIEPHFRQEGVKTRKGLSRIHAGFPLIDAILFFVNTT